MNFQQHEDRISALEVKAGLREAPKEAQTEVQHAQTSLDAAIARAKAKAEQEGR